MLNYVNPNEPIALALYGKLPLRKAVDPNSTLLEDHDCRLIAIESAPSDSQLRCKLSTTSLAEASKNGYSALSYVWGDASDTQPIIINGHTFQATKNLVAALNDIISSTQDPLPPIWVDAICINQCDMAERSSQVKLMGMIYGNCKEALCWLGPEDGDDNGINGRICQFLDVLVNDLNHDPTMHVDEDGAMPLFSSLKSPIYRQIIGKMGLQRERFLMAPIFNKRYHTYWSRVWTFQEVVLSPLSKFVTTKRETCYLVDRLENINMWLHNLHVDGLLYVESIPEGISPQVWDFIKLLAADREAPSPVNDVLFARRSLVSGSRGFIGSVKAFKPRVLSTVQTIRERNATDPRDKLFGVAGLTAIGIDIDYSLSTQAVYTKFAAKMVAEASGIKKATLYPSSHDQDVLFYAAGKAAPGLSQLPSWVPDWTVPIFPIEGTKYSANKNAPAGNATLPLTVSDDEATLIAFGMTLDIVQDILPLPQDFGHEHPRKARMQHIAAAVKFLARCNNQDDLSDAQQIIEQLMTEPPTSRIYTPTGEPLLHAILRLTVAERDIRDGTTPGHGNSDIARLAHAIPPIIICLLNDVLSSGTKSAIEKFDTLWDGEDNHITAKEGLEYLTTQLLNPTRSNPLPLSLVLRHARAVYNPQRFEDFFFHSPFFKLGMDVPCRTNTGYVGYASPGIQAGDVITVLGSQDVPIVLRSRNDSYKEASSESKKEYEFISRSHVLGVMYGEAWDLAGKGKGVGNKVQIECFHIV